MVVSHMVFWTALLALGAHPQHSCPAGAGAPADPTNSAVAGDLAAGGGRFEAPVVVVREETRKHDDPAGEVFSADYPAYWTRVPYGPLAVEVRLMIPADDPALNVTRKNRLAVLAEVTLLLDGEPVDNNRYLNKSWPDFGPRQDAWRRVDYLYTLPCPAPGKHILQARYKRLNVWSELSTPLYFEVRLPDPPRIMAVADFGRDPVPVGENGLISITTGAMMVRLASVNRYAHVVAYLDGRPVTSAETDASCCRKVPLEGHVTTGVHTLTVRTVHFSGPGSSVTSGPSNEVVFHYCDESIYLLKPCRKCDNRNPPAKPDCQEQPVQAEINKAADVPASPPLFLQAGFPHFPPAVASDPRPSLHLLTASETTKPAKVAPSAEAEPAETPKVQRVGPFFFASPAHFPIREFGPRGEVIEREGAVIYEDMTFSFDDDGNYNLRFTIRTPALPTTIQLQLLLQPATDKPWYTITLAPMDFFPDPEKSGRMKPKLYRNCIVEGRSEILSRCWREMEQDARLRRTGTARFGYGLEALNQTASY